MFHVRRALITIRFWCGLEDSFAIVFAGFFIKHGSKEVSFKSIFRLTKFQQHGFTSENALCPCMIVYVLMLMYSAVRGRVTTPCSSLDNDCTHENDHESAIADLMQAYSYVHRATLDSL